MQSWLELDRTRRAISYTRFSHPSQMLGDSLRRQIAAAEKVAQTYGLELDANLRFEDLALSAYRGRNRTEGALGKIIDAAEAKALPVGIKLIVESLDRISRQNPYDALGQVRELCDLGVIIVTASDLQVYSRERLSKAPEAAFVLQGILMRAHDESRQKSIRVRDAREANRQALRDGKGKLPRMLPGWLIRVDGKAVEIPDRTETLRLIYRLAADGEGSSTIAKRLNRENRAVFSRRGQGINDERKACGWDAGRIVELIASEAPRGYYQPHTRNPATEKREPTGDPIRCLPVVIDDATWQLAHGHQRRRSRSLGPDRVPVTARVANLLSGIATCSFCGGRVSRFWQATRKGPRPFLVCDVARRALMSKEGDRICNGVGRHPYDAIEQALLLAVAPLIASRAPTGASVQHGGAIEQALEAVAKAQDDAHRAGRRLKRISDLDDDDPLLLDAMKERKNAMVRLKSANEHLERAQSTDAAQEAMIRAMGALIASVADGHEPARERMRDALRDTVSATVYPDYTKITMRGTASTIRIDKRAGLDMDSLDRLLTQLKV